MDRLEYTGDELDDSEDEDMSWYTEDLKSTYFVIVNNSRKTIKPGEQIFFCYGNETNDHFMLRYGFCFENNKYDSYQVKLSADLFEKTKKAG